MWQLWLKICGAHRSDDQTEAAGVNEFFLPKLTRGFFLRAGIVALAAIIVFGFILRPCFIDGGSMLPNWPEKGFTFCFRWRYLFSKPQRGDVVIVHYSKKVYFLKRVVALPGDTVAFSGAVFSSTAALSKNLTSNIFPPGTCRPAKWRKTTIMW